MVEALDQSGQVIGDRYRIIAPLGQGGMGIIATALAVRTLGVEHTPSHRVDSQTGQVACESD